MLSQMGHRLWNEKGWNTSLYRIFFGEKTSTFALSLSHLTRECSPKNRKYERTTGGSLDNCFGDSNMTNRNTISLRDWIKFGCCYSKINYSIWVFAQDFYLLPLPSYLRTDRMHRSYVSFALILSIYLTANTK